MNRGNFDPRVAVASLLAAMPRLRVLRCPLLQGMALMVQCRSLKSLELRLEVNEDTRIHLPGVETFLRSAVTHLEHLEVTYIPRDEERAVSTDAVNLLLSIGGSGKHVTALRSLKFDAFVDEWTLSLLVRPLVTILPRLAHLTVLEIDSAPSDDFLRALDGKVLPQLVELCVGAPDDVCQHKFAHSDRIYDLLLAYPRLHVKVEDFYDPCPGSDCDFCDKYTCHPNPKRRGAIIFTHPLKAPCEVYHISVDYDNYRNMRIVERFVSLP